MRVLAIHASLLHTDPRRILILLSRSRFTNLNICQAQKHSWFSKRSCLVTGSDQLILPVLVIACDRVTVKRCLDNLVKFRPSKETFPIIVSQVRSKETGKRSWLLKKREFFFVWSAAIILEGFFDCLTELKLTRIEYFFPHEFLNCLKLPRR